MARARARARDPKRALGSPGTQATPFLGPGPGPGPVPWPVSLLPPVIPMAAGHANAKGAKGSVARAQEGINGKGNVVDI